MPINRRLILAHFWLAFCAFAAAALLGVWQMWVRSPLSAPQDIPARYFQSVTGHGVAMAYVLPTFFIMGFGYYVAEVALRRGTPFPRVAWAAFFAGLAGVIMTVASIAGGQASVLYTFYPPMTATVWFYVGLVLVVAASWVWCVLMILVMASYKKAEPGRPVPLAMTARVTLVPCLTVTEAGCFLISGTGRTLTVVALLVTLPAPLVMTTL